MIEYFWKLRPMAGKTRKHRDIKYISSFPNAAELEWNDAQNVKSNLNEPSVSKDDHLGQASGWLSD